MDRVLELSFSFYGHLRAEILDTDVVDSLSIYLKFINLDIIILGSILQVLSLLKVELQGMQASCYCFVMSVFIVEYIFFMSVLIGWVQIEDGEIFATINQKDGMVQFHDNPEKYNSPNMLLELDKEVRITTLKSE